MTTGSARGSEIKDLHIFPKTRRLQYQNKNCLAATKG